MIHYVYIITNNVNGRKYIGTHSTKNIDDNYMGCGKALNLAKKKYGIENFSKEIKSIFETEKEAFDKESELIEKYNAVDSMEFYNMASGGLGGYESTRAGKTELEKWEINNRMRNSLKGKMAGEKNPMYGKRGINNPKYGIPLTDEQKENIRKALKGKPFTEEHKENIRKSRIGMKLSESHKANIGLALKGRCISDKCKKASREANIKNIVLLNDLSVYESITDAMNTYKIARQSIGKVCMGERNYAGIINNEKAIWMYLDDYNYCIENSIDFNLYKKEKYHK